MVSARTLGKVVEFAQVAIAAAAVGTTSRLIVVSCWTESLAAAASCGGAASNLDVFAVKAAPADSGRATDKLSTMLSDGDWNRQTAVKDGRLKTVC